MVAMCFTFDATVRRHDDSDKAPGSAAPPAVTAGTGSQPADRPGTSIVAEPPAAAPDADGPIGVPDLR